MAPSFYTIVIFLPLIIIFSVNGLIYIKKFIANISERVERIFPFILLFLSVGYSLLYVEIILKINLWYLFVLLIISLLFYLFVFIINNNRSKFFLNISFDSVKLQKGLWIFILIISILIFTLTTVEGRLRSIDNNPYPWENRYLTEEEIEIIDYFQKEEINGLIFTTAGILIAERLAGVGFLPVFNNQTLDGKSIYYGFIPPNEVHQHTEFTLILSRLVFFELNDYIVKYPIRELMRSILKFNVTNENDIHALQSYNIQYIISINENYLTNGGNQWPLIQSLPFEFEPVFSTQHLLVWKIY